MQTFMERALALAERRRVCGAEVEAFLASHPVPANDHPTRFTEAFLRSRCGACRLCPSVMAKMAAGAGAREVVAPFRQAVWARVESQRIA